jgi:acyl-CoA thioester hydrolase
MQLIPFLEGIIMTSSNGTTDSKPSSESNQQAFILPRDLNSSGPFPVGDFEVRVYFEDTDSLGITYHGSYVHFLDRARYHYWKDHVHLIVRGIPEGQWQTAAAKILPNIYSLQIVYFKSTQLDDILSVRTLYHPISDYRSLWEQRIIRQKTGEVVLGARVEVVYLNREGKLIPLPDADSIKDLP